MVDNRIYHSKQVLIPIQQKTSNYGVTNSTNVTTPFSHVLSQAIDDVKFSQHALQRLQSRNIKLGSSDLVKLNDAVDRVAAKGSKESLLYLDNMAFVVSVTNRTVITAMDGSSAKENIFTNIDSAAIL